MGFRDEVLVLMEKLRIEFYLLFEKRKKFLIVRMEFSWTFWFFEVADLFASTSVKVHDLDEDYSVFADSMELADVL